MLVIMLQKNIGVYYANFSSLSSR